MDEVITASFATDERDQSTMTAFASASARVICSEYAGPTNNSRSHQTVQPCRSLMKVTLLRRAVVPEGRVVQFRPPVAV